MEMPVQLERDHENVLTRLLPRLEAATSRLEDIASSTGAAESGHSTTTGIASTPAAVATASQAAIPSPASTPAQAPLPKEDLPASIEDFDGLTQGDLKTYHDSSKSQGGVIGEQVSYCTFRL